MMAAAPGRRRVRTPPPDLPSIMLDARIVYLGMPVRIARVCSVSSQMLFDENENIPGPAHLPLACPHRSSSPL